MQKVLSIIGLSIAAIGVLSPYLKQLGLSQLPGDIILKGEQSTFLFFSRKQHCYKFFSFY